MTNTMTAPFNPNANPHYAVRINGSTRYDVELTVRNDAGDVLWRGHCPQCAKRHMEEHDPSGWELRCVTADGRPVSLLNV